MTAPLRIWALAIGMDQRPSVFKWRYTLPNGDEIYQRESGDRATVLLSQLKVLWELDKE